MTIMDIFLPILLFLFVAANVMQCCVADELADGVVEWVQSKGGYFNDKLEIRRLDPADETSPLGVYAKADLELHETLMQVPQECYIDVSENAIHQSDLTADEKFDEYVRNLCLLAKEVMKELKLGDDSKYPPYVKYLQNQSRGQLPATWSTDAKELLRDLLPEHINGVDWIDTDFKGSCFEMSDPLEEHVVALTKARCYDTSMIPIWDMVNHDNGKLNTHNTPMYAEGGIRVWSTKEIKAGEQIYATYDECVDCEGVSAYWGTPEILRDFGFVEGYPHRFVFPDEGIWWEIWEGTDGEKEVRWDDHGQETDSYENPDDYYGPPDEDGISVLEDELERINQLPPEEYNCSSNANMPSFECAMITKYKAIVTEALSLAIEEAESLLDEEEHDEL